MEQLFKSLSEKLINSLESGEHLKVSIDGEQSQFIRFSQSKVTYDIDFILSKSLWGTNLHEY